MNVNQWKIYNNFTLLSTFTRPGKVYPSRSMHSVYLAVESSSFLTLYVSGFLLDQVYNYPCFQSFNSDDANLLPIPWTSQVIPVPETLSSHESRTNLSLGQSPQPPSLTNYVGTTSLETSWQPQSSYTSFICFIFLCCTYYRWIFIYLTVDKLFLNSSSRHAHNL